MSGDQGRVDLGYSSAVILVRTRSERVAKIAECEREALNWYLYSSIVYSMKIYRIRFISASTLSMALSATEAMVEAEGTSSNIRFLRTTCLLLVPKLLSPC